MGWDLGSTLELSDNAGPEQNLVLLTPDLQGNVRA